MGKIDRIVVNIVKQKVTELNCVTIITDIWEE